VGGKVRGDVIRITEGAIMRVTTNNVPYAQRAKTFIMSLEHAVKRVRDSMPPVNQKLPALGLRRKVILQKKGFVETRVHKRQHFLFLQRRCGERKRPNRRA